MYHNKLLAIACPCCAADPCGSRKRPQQPGVMANDRHAFEAALAQKLDALEAEESRQRSQRTRGVDTYAAARGCPRTLQVWRAAECDSRPTPTDANSHLDLGAQRPGHGLHELMRRDNENADGLSSIVGFGNVQHAARCCSKSGGGHNSSGERERENSSCHTRMHADVGRPRSTAKHHRAEGYQGALPRAPPAQVRPGHLDARRAAGIPDGLDDAFRERRWYNEVALGMAAEEIQASRAKAEQYLRRRDVSDSGMRLAPPSKGELRPPYAFRR